MRIALLALAGASVAATPPASPAAAPAAATLPSFAAQLAQRSLISRPADWATAGRGAGWPTLATASPASRQSARWAYALRRLADDHAPEAWGVLQTMLAADGDLALVPAFQLAEGVALTGMTRGKDAIAVMAAPELAANPEACAWRLRALELASRDGDALAQVNCALPAINARHGAERLPFVIAATRAALGSGHATAARQWLTLLPERDAATNALRGRALVATGQSAGRAQLERAATSRSPETRAEAQLALVELGVTQGTLARGPALQKLDAIRFVWRGGDVERRALWLSYRLAKEGGQTTRALMTGAALVRYFDLGSAGGPLVTDLQSMLAAALAPGSTTPIAEAAGIFWDYRDLTPAGAAGDELADRLAQRLQAAGLPGRAAELLEYQLTQRTQDVARGPLSVRVAMLEILAGHPDRALNMLHNSEDPNYTDAMRWDRKRMEAVALFKLGKTAAAAAALDDVPGGAAIRAEMVWKARDWNGVVDQFPLPPPRALDDVGQALVLRQAVALAMLGREDALAKLHLRYTAAFRGLPSAGAFDLLTGPLKSVDPSAIGKAMAAIPSASPAGNIGDLLDTPRG